MRMHIPVLMLSKQRCVDSTIVVSGASGYRTDDCRFANFLLFLSPQSRKLLIILYPTYVISDFFDVY